MLLRYSIAFVASLIVSGCTIEVPGLVAQDGAFVAEDATFAVRVRDGIIALRAGGEEVRIETDGVPRAVRENEGAVEIDRGYAIERIDWREGTISQSWSFDQAPAGDAVVRVHVDGARLASVDARGVLLHSPGARTGFRYGHGTWIDAAGFRTPVPALIADGAIELRVPASVVERSRFPAILDPVIGPEVVLDDDPRPRTAGVGAEVVWTGARYLAMWGGWPVVGNAIRTDGTVDHPIGRTITDGDTGVWGRWSVASNGTVTVAAWSETQGVVRIARLDPLGFQLGSPIVVGTLGGDPSVATDGTGFVVMWRGASHAHVVEGLRLGPDGIPVDTAPRTLLSFGASDRVYELLVSSNGSEWVVAMLQGDATTRTIRAQRIAADLSVPVGTATPVATGGASDISLVAAVRGGSEVAIGYELDSRAAVKFIQLDGSVSSWTLSVGGYRPDFGIAHDGTAWIAASTASGTSYQLYRFSSSALIATESSGSAGSSIACSPSECLVATNTTPVGVRVGRDLLPIGSAIDVAQIGNPQESVAVASDGTRSIAVWMDGVRPVHDIRAARVDAIGQIVDSSPLEIASAPGRDEVRPAVASGGGTFLIAWWEALATTYELRARRVSPAGSVDASSVALGGTGDSNVHPATIAWTGAHFLAAWGTFSGAAYRRIGADASLLGSVEIVDALRVSRAALSVAPDGSALLAFSRFDGQVRGAIIAPDGTAGPSFSISSAVNGSVAAAWNGVNHVVVWHRNTSGGTNTRDLRAARVTAAGSVIDFDGVVVAPPAAFTGNPIAASSSGGDVLVGLGLIMDPTWASDAPRQSLEGVMLDGALIPSARFAMTLDPVLRDGYPEVALVGAGWRWLLGYSRFDPSSGSTVRARARFISVGGIACAGPADCASNHCVDGVCCDEACGGGIADCMACSVAAGGATDGTCGPLAPSIASSVACRPRNGLCDVTEHCSVGSRDCAIDRVATAVVVCRDAADACDTIEHCTGADAECPADAVLADGASCENGVACDGAELCLGGACSSGLPPSCDDGDVCTADGCAEPTGCAHSAIDGCCRAASDCDDRDPCTSDRCVSSSCSHELVPACERDGSVGLDGAVMLDGAMPLDAGTRDASSQDAAVDADAEPTSRPTGGCGCGVARSSAAGWGGIGMLAVIAGSLRRRRRAG